MNSITTPFRDNRIRPRPGLWPYLFRGGLRSSVGAHATTALYPVFGRAETRKAPPGFVDGAISRSRALRRLTATARG